MHFAQSSGKKGTPQVAFIIGVKRCGRRKVPGDYRRAAVFPDMIEKEQKFRQSAGGGNAAQAAFFAVYLRQLLIEFMYSSNDILSHSDRNGVV